MKYYFLAGLVVLAGVVAVVLSKSGSSVASADVEHYANKRHIAEAETKVRPASFEAMKWTRDAEVELRAPASSDKK